MTTGGLSESRLRRMHEIMRGYVERQEVHGLVTLVCRRGEVHVDAIGKRKIGGDQVSRDTIFRISSMTKPITAVAALILVEECKLRLDEPVDNLLPELANRKVLKRMDSPLNETFPAKRPITVRDLLTFRMGFGIVFAPPRTYPIQKAMDDLQLGQGPPNPSNFPSPEEWIKRLGTLPLMHQPGEKWMYNTGTDVLGVLIARASGQSFESFLRERIFVPLGMKDTSFDVPVSKLDRFTDHYWTNPMTGKFELYDEAQNGQWSRPPKFASGSGGLVSTVDDYNAFSELLLNKGKLGSEQILSRASIEMMTTDQLTSEQKSASGLGPGFFDHQGWGFGLSVITRRHSVFSVGTFGWNGGLGTMWNCDPKEEMTTIIMTQCAWTSPSPPNVCLDFFTLAYSALEQ
jgi:CubicO group peptidase (beta-lactamase class C family)